MRTILNNSKMPKDKEMKFSHFNVTLLKVILHTLTIVIVLNCCHENLLFLVYHIIFGVGNLNNFQDNGWIILKFGGGMYF